MTVTRWVIALRKIISDARPHHPRELVQRSFREFVFFSLRLTLLHEDDSGSLLFVIHWWSRLCV